MEVAATTSRTATHPLYKIRLSDFEGPLDLLLFFIKRDELDIYNIPITKITQEFLEYLRFMTALDLDVAGEFIVMAAELCQIKAKMLLPREENSHRNITPLCREPTSRPAHWAVSYIH